MTARLATLLTFALVTPVSIHAQDATDPEERVRVTRVDGSVVVGALQSHTSHMPELVLVQNDSSITIPRDQIQQLERSVGQKRGFAESFGITFATSSLGLGAVMALGWTPCTDTGFLACFLHPDSRGEAFSWGVVGGAVLGVPIGVIVGLMNRGERWEPMSFNGPSGAVISLQPIVSRSFGMAGTIKLGPR